MSSFVLSVSCPVWDNSMWFTSINWLIYPGSRVYKENKIPFSTTEVVWKNKKVLTGPFSRLKAQVCQLLPIPPTMEDLPSTSSSAGHSVPKTFPPPAPTSQVVEKQDDQETKESWHSAKERMRTGNVCLTVVSCWHWQGREGHCLLTLCQPSANSPIQDVVGDIT